jgi:TolB protein
VTARRTVGLALALAAMGVAGAGLPATAAAAYPGQNGLFAVEGDTFPGIWTVTPTGSALKRLTTPQGLPMNPSWSPDGQWIAYVQNGELWKMRADGTAKKRLAGGLGADIGTNISWAPNSARLAFDRNRDLWTINASGFDLRRITMTPTIEMAPSWKPTGGMLAFQFMNPNNATFELRLIRPSGAGETPIPNTQFAAEPDWAPGGNRLVYSNQGDLFTINPNGSGKQPFVNTSGQRLAVDAAWSPDGKQIAYALLVNEDDTRIIRRPVAPAGMPHVVIAHKHWFSPSWQPR